MKGDMPDPGLGAGGSVSGMDGVGSCCLRLVMCVPLSRNCENFSMMGCRFWFEGICDWVREEFLEGKRIRWIGGNYGSKTIRIFMKGMERITAQMDSSEG